MDLALKRYSSRGGREVKNLPLKKLPATNVYAKDRPLTNISNLFKDNFPRDYHSNPLIKEVLNFIF
jgi:hypothetical protein